MTMRQQFWAMAITAALLALPVWALAQPAPPPPPGASTHNSVVEPRTLREGRRASRVIGATVYTDAGESIGQVDDLLIPREAGPPIAILSVGGFLGIGAKLVAVPYESLRQAADRWTLPGASKESLNALPGYSYDNTAARPG